jgi:hypothetical protein
VIESLQKPGPLKKIVLSAILLIILAAMVFTIVYR